MGTDEFDARKNGLKMKRNIFNIQRFSTKDGPGIRTTVFFQGCHLNCAWCHNPESIPLAPRLQYFEDKCCGCRACERVCKKGVHTFDADGKHHLRIELCVLCGQCVTCCPTESLQYRNKDYTVEELADIVLKDKAYYQSSGGGVTLSGGEPMLQADYILQLLKTLKEHGIHTAVDTAANVAFAEFKKVMPYTDLFLVDIKAMDPDVHKAYTGVKNDLILKNIERLSGAGQDIIIRMPVIKGVNDDVGGIRKAGEFLAKQKNIRCVQLLPYHSYGLYKGASVGIERRDFAPPENIEQLVGELCKFGIKAEV